MGGNGSGYWYRWNKADVVEDYLKLDIRYLSRKGILQAGYSSSLTWSSNGHQTGSIGINMIDDSFVKLQYTCNSKNINEHIHLEYTDCNYGGKRAWFICPSCNRRCAILYGGMYFRCRECYKLKYSTQNMIEAFRLLEKKNKIRDKLKMDDYDISSKPKRMHWKTYENLLDEYYRLDYESLLSITQRYNR